MRAKRDVKGLYALMEAFWDFTNALTCSIRGAILVALCFLIGGIVVIGMLFVIGHNHDQKLAAEIRAQNEHMARLARDGSVGGIPIAPQHLPPATLGSHSAHHGYPTPHATYPASAHHAYLAPQASYPHHAYPAAHASYPTHQTPLVVYPTHQTYPQTSAYSVAPGAQNPHAYSQAPQGYNAYRSHAYQQPYQQLHQQGLQAYSHPVNPAALDSIYESEVTRTQYNQMMQNTPMVANPYGSSMPVAANTAPIDQPPASFGQPINHHVPAIADANEFAGAEAGRAEAEQGHSVLNTY